MSAPPIGNHRPERPASESFARARGDSWAEARRCLRVRDGSSGCRRCEETCPRDAISLPRGVGIFAVPVVNESRCDACGLCAGACPVDLFSAWRWDLDSGSPPPIVEEVCCRRSGAPGRKGTLVGECLGALAESDLLFLLSRGGETVILRRGDCAGCGRSEVPRMLEERVQRVRLLARRIGCAREIILEGVPGGTAHSGIPRRSFFEVLVRARSPQADQPPGPRPERRLGDALRALVRSTAGDVLCVGTPLHPRVLTGRCVGEGRCAGICPTGALALTPRPEGDALTFDVSLCVGCELCTRACAHGGLDTRPSTDGAQLGRRVQLRPLPTPRKTCLSLSGVGSESPRIPE